MRVKLIGLIGATSLVLGTVLTLSFSDVNSRDEVAATCSGSKSCKACKNCKYCKHCDKEGGTCGVCKP